MLDVLNNYEWFSVDDLNIKKNSLILRQTNLGSQINLLRNNLTSLDQDISNAVDDNSRSNIVSKIWLIKDDLWKLYAKQDNFINEIEWLDLQINKLNNQPPVSPDIWHNTLDLEIWDICEDIKAFIDNSFWKTSRDLVFHLENTLWINWPNYRDWIDNLYRSYLAESDSENKNKILSHINFLNEIVKNAPFHERIILSRNKMSKILTWWILWAGVWLLWWVPYAWAVAWGILYRSVSDNTEKWVLDWIWNVLSNEKTPSVLKTIVKWSPPWIIINWTRAAISWLWASWKFWIKIAWVWAAWTAEIAGWVVWAVPWFKKVWTTTDWWWKWVFNKFFWDK